MRFLCVPVCVHTCMCVCVCKYMHTYMYAAHAGVLKWSPEKGIWVSSSSIVPMDALLFIWVLDLNSYSRPQDCAAWHALKPLSRLSSP